MAVETAFTILLCEKGRMVIKACIEVHTQILCHCSGNELELPLSLATPLEQMHSAFSKITVPRKHQDYGARSIRCNEALVTSQNRTAKNDHTPKVL